MLGKDASAASKSFEIDMGHTDSLNFVDVANDFIAINDHRNRLALISSHSINYVWA